MVEVGLAGCWKCVCNIFVVNLHMLSFLVCVNVFAGFFCINGIFEFLSFTPECYISPPPPLHTAGSIRILDFIDGTLGTHTLGAKCLDNKSSMAMWKCCVCRQYNIFLGSLLAKSGLCRFDCLTCGQFVGNNFRRSINCSALTYNFLIDFPTLTLPFLFFSFFFFIPLRASQKCFSRSGVQSEFRSVYKDECMCVRVCVIRSRLIGYAARTLSHT